MMVIGPTNCGKMHWINRLLGNDMFTEPVNSILYCYGVYQEFFDSMHENISCSIQFYKGIPSMEDIDRIHDGQFHIIVLDDMMECIVKNEDMAELFTMHCHHHNITAIMVSQNQFLKGKHLRTISLSTHVHVLFGNKRDELQINIFANQLFQRPSEKKIFLKAYDECMSHPYSFMVIDCTLKMPCELKVCTNIFPGEITYTWDL